MSGFKKLTNLPLNLLVAIAGGALCFAFAPFHLFPIAILSPALLLYAWSKAKPTQAFVQGFIFGATFFTAGVHWIYISVHDYGHANFVVASVITLLFICYLALFYGSMGLVFTLLRPKNIAAQSLLLFPVLWTSFELLRSILLSGFPWLLLGYTQTDSWLRGYAPIIGVYGLSLMVCFFSALLVLIIQSKRASIRSTDTIVFISLFLVGYGLTTFHWTDLSKNPVKVALIQGNIHQDLKWQPQQIIHNLNIYFNHTQENWENDLIVWPEAAIAIPLSDAKEIVQTLAAEAKLHHTTVVSGIPIIEPTQAFNGMIALGNGSGIYHKRHLIPFGEYIPYRFLFNLLFTSIEIPMSDFTPGQKQQVPLLANGILIAPYICYEVACPLEFLAFLPKAELLLTVNDDSWFGRSIALTQHLQMAQMRAIETGRFLLFSSNTGMTAVFDAQGELVKSVPSFQEIVLHATVYPMTGTTPWVRWGLLPLECYFVLVGLVLGYLRLKMLFQGKWFPDNPLVLEKVRGKE